MSLPVKVVDRVFHRLSATYGAEFLQRYAGLDVGDVRTAWAHELDRFGDNLPAIAWALENLPERAPNVIAFRTLCSQAPRPEAPRIEAPAPDPERLRDELEKLAPVRAASAAAVAMADGRDWARRLLARASEGGDVRPICVRFAREALRLPQERAA